MKLLVFAHTPPPVHGQSIMVETLVNGLRGDPDIELQHVNVRLSYGSTDIGRARAGKLLPLLGACVRAVWLRARRGRHALYYVPAPGRRVPFLRDVSAMLMLRPFFAPVIFHWHAVGLGRWLREDASFIERAFARVLLGHADLSIVLADELGTDAAMLSPRRTVTVRNCAPDPGEPAMRRRDATMARTEVLFIGLCSREKGLFDSIEGIAIAERNIPGAFHLTIAGAFESARDEREFQERIAQLPGGLVNHVGFAAFEQKRALYEKADVFCFPTVYPHEGQPLTIIEALAHDVPIITTHWRAIPGMLPASHVWFVPPNAPRQIANALQAARASDRPAGTLRRHYLMHFTPDRHLAAMKAALLSVSG